MFNQIIDYITQYWAELGIGALAVLFGGLILYAVAKGKLNFLKPKIKELIIQAEIWAQNEELEKAGVEKMAKVVGQVVDLLPKWAVFILNDNVIKAVCQNVYDLIQDTLLDLTEEYKNKYLTEKQPTVK